MSDDPEESAYYLRLVSMYMDIGTETVLGVFVHHSPGRDAEAFLQANQQAIFKLKADHTLNEQECASLLQKGQKGKHILKNPLDLNRFDVSLLITLARNLFTNQQLPPPTKGWKYPPKNKDKSIAADLMRLKKTRNVIVGHHPKARLPKWRFEDEWQKVSEIILRIQQQISPGNVIHFKERIENYRVQRLDPSVETKYDEKLKEWHKEVAEMQDQVEKLIKKLEGFDAYFKSKSDRFERYTKLLFKGGHFVLSAFLSKTIEKEGKDLRSILDENKDTLKTNITDSKQLDILYPPTSITESLDTSSWDVSLLATVILQLFVSTKDRGMKRNVKRIGDAHKNYVESALVALDSNTFEDYWTDLKASIEIVSYKLDENKADRYYQILEECKKKISEHEFQTYMDELKKQGSEMKTFTDIFKDTLQKTKDLLQDMITHGINFKNDHDLELKMITLGNNEEKKKLAEEILTEVWHEALDRSIQTSDFPEVKKEVLKILEEIKKSKSVKNITIRTKCILLQISCTSPSDMLNMINYFESDRCHESLRIISQELGYFFDTVLAVYSVVPIDCLWAISNGQGESIQPEERGVSLPITVSSPAGMKHLISLCGSEEIANSTNSIADALSKHLEDTIALKTSTDMKELGTVFDADKSSSDSSSDCSTTESSVINSNQLNQPDASEEFPEEKSPGNIPEEMTVQELDDKTDHLKECHKDKSIQKETESDIYTAESSDSDESDWKSLWTERGYSETKVQRYRIWVRAGLRLHVLKMYLNEICDKAVESQHKELLDNVKKKKGLSILSCHRCNLKTLLPDHVQTEHKQCPLGYLNCNCLNPTGKSSCPNNLCGALYDNIIGLFKATPPSPFWENTNVQTWCTDPWSIAKCFISKSGYATKTKASEFDIKELLFLLKNSKELLRNITMDIYRPKSLFHEEDEDDFLQVCRCRDSLYYSKEMELDSRTDHKYRRAVLNVVFSTANLGFRIKTLKFPDANYIVTSKDEALVHADVIAALSEEAKYLEQKITSYQETNLSEKEIEDEEVHVKKRRFESILKESLQAVLLPQESKEERLEPGISGQEVPAKKRRLISTIYGHSYATNMPTESEAGQEPTTSYRTVEDIEDYKTQLEKIKTLISVHREKMAYIDSKIDIQKRLVKLYRENCVKVPALPIQPEENQKDVGDVYVEPWMTIIEEDDPSRKTSEVRERKISSFFEVFRKGGKRIKTVYVLGEAGTGKSTFCKSLVHKWCEVHIDGGHYVGKDKRNIKRFEFLFFVLLRHHLDKQTIEMMLDSQFRHPVLQTILDFESDKCLILLDGLDEWIPKSLSHSQIETKGLPARDNAKDYTVVTTSRPWKIGLLGMTTNEIHQKVMLRGIDKSATKILIEKTIKLLNATFEENRSPEKFIKYLKTSPLSDIQHLPILLEQLICLWYENNDLSKSSRCTLYNGMLELPFKWFDQRQREKLESNHGSEIKGRSETKDLLSLHSPHALDKDRIYSDYRNTIDNASKLAFELLFKQRQENTLSFDIQTCKHLQIPLDVLKVCVNIGILSEEKTIGFTSGGQNESSFSFVHKSIQEFLTAVHIAAIFKTYSLPESEREETMPSRPMPEQEYSTSLSHVLELDDTTCQRQGRGQDIAPLHPASEMQNIMNQPLSSEREDITFQHPDSQLEMITSPKYVSERDDILSPQTGPERKEITCSHSGSQREYLTSPNTDSVKENIASPHLSSLRDDMPSMFTRSERDTMSSHLRSKTEDMSGRENAGWPDVCEDFIQKYCARIKTIENILEMANVFVFLSGLQPRLATYISKYIYNTANRSTLVVQHRKTLDDCAFLYDIQRCISGCCDEANSNATCFRHTIYLGDCFLDDSESVLQSRLNSNTVQHVIPDSIASLSVSFSRACALYRGSSKCDICKLLTHFLSCRRLTKLALNDKRLQTDDGHIQLVKEILETNLQSLQTVSVDYIFGVKFCLKGMETFKPLIASIPNLNQLTSLRVHGINLPHDQCDILKSYLADQVRLQELSLDVECEGKDDHEIDMSTHNTLQYLEIGDGFTVKNVYTEHDMTVKFKIKWADDSSINLLFRILESVKLKYVSLWGNRDEFSKSQFVTHKLRSLFAMSNYLCAIELDSLEITDNILTLPFRLVSIKRIDLSVVTMTMKTWIAFIYSLRSIPNVVHVKALGLVIKNDETFMLSFRTSEFPKFEEARFYIRLKPELFHVTRDDNYQFEFFTYKNDKYY